MINPQSNTIGDFRRLAQVQQTQKHWLEASEVLKSLFERFPESLAFHDYANLANCYLQLSRYEESAQYYQLLDELYPDSLLGLRGLAQVQQTQKHWLEASEVLKSLFERFPESLAFHDYANLANCYLQLSRYEKSTAFFQRKSTINDALKVLKKGLFISENSSAMMSQLFQIYSQFESRKLAILEVENLISSDEAFQNEFFYQLKFRLLLTQGNFDLCKQYLDQLRQSGIDGYKLISFEIDLLISSGNFFDAEKYLLNFRTCNQITNHLGSEKIALIFFSLNKTYHECELLLANFFDQEIIENELKSLYGRKKISDSQNLTEDFKRVDELRSTNPKVIIKQKLKRFLKNRSYYNFENFFEYSLGSLSEKKISKVKIVLDKRFPRSSIRAKLNNYFSKKNIDATCKPYNEIYSWRQAYPVNDYSIASQLKNFEKVNLLLVTVFRDEEEMLPHFIKHYSSIGVENFLFIDNGSIDNSVSKINQFSQLNITLVKAPFDFSFNRHGMSWVNEILEHRLSNWTLFVDTDEFLFYPGCQDCKIEELIHHMELTGSGAFKAFMLDLYDKNYLEGLYPSSQLEDHDYFYANYSLKKMIDAPYENISGGARFSHWAHGGVLEKTPLINSKLGIRYIDNHRTTPVNHCLTTGVLAHYKIFRDRDYLQLTENELIQNSRISDRGLACVARHLNFINDRKKLILSPFHLKFSLQTLEKLDLINFDKLWSEKVLDSQIPFKDNFQFPYSLVSCPSKLHDGSLAMSLSEILIYAYESIKETNSLFKFLKFQFSRISDKRIRKCITDVLKIATGKTTSKSKSSILSNEIFIEPDLFIEFFKYLENDKFERLIEVLDFLYAFPNRTDQTNQFLAEKYFLYGKESKTREILKKINLINSKNIHLLRSFMHSDQWDLVFRSIDMVFDDPDYCPNKSMLTILNLIPYQSQREKRLNIFFEKLQEKLIFLNPEVVSCYLAVIFIRKDFNQLPALFDIYGKFLDEISYEFYSRWLKIYRNEIKTFNRLTCISLSKMGTTSLNVFMSRAGLLSAHFINPVTQSLLDPDDIKVFDFVCDTTAVFFTRKNLVEYQKIIFINRVYKDWEKSFLHHFSLELSCLKCFDEQKRVFYSSVDALEKSKWYEVHHELYFRFATLRDAYNYQQKWALRLSETLGPDLLLIDLYSKDVDLQLSNFVGIQIRLNFPRGNITNY